MQNLINAGREGSRQIVWRIKDDVIEHLGPKDKYVKKDSPNKVRFGLRPEEEESVNQPGDRYSTKTEWHRKRS